MGPTHDDAARIGRDAAAEGFPLSAAVEQLLGARAGTDDDVRAVMAAAEGWVTSTLDAAIGQGALDPFVGLETLPCLAAVLTLLDEQCASIGGLAMHRRLVLWTLPRPDRTLLTRCSQDVIAATAPGDHVAIVRPDRIAALLDLRSSDASCEQIDRLLPRDTQRTELDLTLGLEGMLDRLARAAIPVDPNHGAG